MFGGPPVVVAATGEVVVEVRSPFVVKLSWSGEQFVARNGSTQLAVRRLIAFGVMLARS